MTSDLERLCETKNVRIDARYGAAKKSVDWAAHSWRVTLRFGRRSLSCDFFGGAAVSEPSAADVISSLLLDGSSGEESFPDFCANLGYDEDSRKAHKTWKSCQSMAPKIRKFLGDDYDAFLHAEH